MESVADKLRAFLFALLVHLAAFGLLFFGLFWTRSARPVSIPGAVIEATIVGPAAAPKPPPAKKAKRPPRRQEPAPPKPPEPKPEAPSQPRRNDAVEREKVAAIAKEAEKAARAEEERHRQEQIRLEDQQKREAERLRQLADIRRQRQAAEKRRKLEQQRLAQLDDLQKQKARQPAPPDVPAAEQARTGMQGQDTSLASQYYAAIQNAVTQNWLRPDNTPPGLRCTLNIVQIPGGDVLSVKVGTPCNADALTRASIEQAVKRAAPLPYKGYEKVFSREINFNFTYDG